MTTTDLALPGSTALAEVHVPDRPGVDIVADLGRWLQAADLAQRIAEVACRGPFVPRAFQGRPEHAATAILAGAELGLSPGTALRSFHVIEGTASLSAKTMRALILSAGHEFELVEETADHVTVRGRRKGEQDWTTITFTLAEAEAAGLTGKDVWKKWPKRMMTARATTILGDLKFGDVLAGMSCTEELQDRDPAEIEVTVDDVPQSRATAAAVLAAAAPVPAPVSQPAPAPTAVPSSEPEPTAIPEERAQLPASRALMDVIRGLFEGHGIGGRSNADKAARLAVFSRILDRELTAPPELTEDEARFVRDNLMGDAGRALVADVLGRPAAPASEPSAPGDREPEPPDPTVGGDAWAEGDR